MGKLTSKKIILNYDNEESYRVLKSIFNKASGRFLKNDKALIDDDVAERTLCGALKSHLEEELNSAGITEYFVDVEYNRNNGKVKTIIDDDLQIVNIQCDLIVHSRGKNIKQDNLITIEMKKSYRPEEEKDADRKRLRALTKSSYGNDIWSYDGLSFPDQVCRYILGVYYEVDTSQKLIVLEYYKGGQKVSAKKIYYDRNYIISGYKI